MEKLFFILLLSFLYYPVVKCGCGCHRVPGQGFLASRDGMANQNFEALPHTIQSGSNGPSSNQHYSVPNFRILLFQPTFLDFQEQPVGMPHVQSIVLSNPSDQNDIEITAVNTMPPFHTTKFSKKVLPPLTNMTVDLVFLATMVGNIEHTVYLHTSRGNFPYQVFAVGSPNPYRLRAFLSAKVPSNGTFSQYINMYNPYSEPLQITEMYSSGKDLHLELLGNNINGTVGKHWEVPPYEIKAVMKATFYSKEEGVANRFVRIKLEAPASPSDVVIIPFEMIVSSKPGLYTNVDILDFGTLRTMDEPKSLNLNVLNLGSKSLQILSIQVIPPNKAVTVQFTPVVLKASRKHTKIATITFTALHSLHKKQNGGKLVVYTSDEKKQLEVPYQANILHGTIAYSVNKTSFYAADSPTTQVLMITNTFNSTLVIYNATLPPETTDVFTIVNFSPVIMVPPGKLVSPLSLNFHTNDPMLSISTVLRLYTNASIFTIPVHCYNGKLKYEVDNINKDVLDYGTVGVQEQRSLTFRIINNNPVEVSVKEFGTQFEFARLRLMHVANLKLSRDKQRELVNNKTKTSDDESPDDKSDTKLILKSSDVATFKVDIIAPSKEGTYHGQIFVNTLYETIQIPMFMKAVEGALISKPKRIKIKRAFPGRIENYPISIESTFKYNINLKNLSVYPEDPRFYFIRPDFLPKLPPGEKTHIGWVKFDPFRGEIDQCFLCICEIDPACDHWFHSLPLPSDTWELDFNLLEKLRRKWDIVENKQRSNFNASIIIDSSVIKNYIIPVQASLAWPSLVDQSIKFPSTHIGNYSIAKMAITNPSDHPLVVQVVPLLHYPQPEGGLDLLSDRLIVDSFSLDLNGHSLFTLPDLKDGKHDNTKTASALGVNPSPNSLTMMLEPRQKKSVLIGFVPMDEKPKTSIMVVRNNLTILDLVVVHGQGAKTYFKINGKSPGTKSSVLVFQIKADHLKDCNKSTPKARVYPSFTVKGSFTATNAGQLPVEVVSMNINNYECEGYGFRILNCEPFTLMPNASKRIDITFIPDFTTSRVTRSLRVLTTMGQTLDFTLLATLPHHLLPLCASALPRPYWEPYLHIMTAILMSSIFIFIIFFAYFDAQKYVVQCTFTAGGVTKRSHGKDLDVYTAGTVFDLNAIAGVKVRITDKKEKNSSDSTIHHRTTATTTTTTTSTSTTLNTNTASKPVHQTLTKSNSNPNKVNNQVKERRSSISDCSTTSIPSRKSSAASNTVPDEKPTNETKQPTKEPSTPPKKTRRKTQDHQRTIHRQNLYLEPQEPKIVTEEISDPWEKQKLRHEADDDKHKNKKRTKANTKKEPTNHHSLQKENSNGSGVDDDHQDDKPAGFMTVENKLNNKVKKGRTEYSGQGNMDKLDEISLNGPRPDVKEHPKKPTSLKMHKSGQGKNKKNSFHHEKERLAMDTPHEIAAKIIEDALTRSQQKKKTGSPSTSNKSSPKHAPYDESESKSKKSKKDTSAGGITSYLKKMIGGARDHSEPDSPTQNNGNSMFYYDNLSSLRASKKPRPKELERTSSSPLVSTGFSSTLSPEVPEFVPLSQRINKAPGTKVKKDAHWASVDDSALEYLRPPPGLSKPSPHNIWGLENSSTSTTSADNWSKPHLFPDFKTDSTYSTLLGSPRGPKETSTFSSLDFLASCSRDERDSGGSRLWKSDSIDKDLFGSSTSLGRSIWDAPDIPCSVASGSLSARSRLGLGLDLNPINDASGMNNTDSPLDPFNIWASSTDPVSPYAGWNKDIKEE